MPDVTELIELLRTGQNEAALALLAQAPELATAHPDDTGLLHGASPLHWAAHRNAVAVCERLIALGADVNDSDSDWWLTPLAWGADSGSAEAVEVLLKAGADVHQDAIVGTTALHAVAMGGSSQGKARPEAYRRTAELLLQFGADVNHRAQGDRQQTPLDDALRCQNEVVAEVLLAASGQATG